MLVGVGRDQPGWMRACDDPDRFNTWVAFIGGDEFADQNELLAERGNLLSIDGPDRSMRAERIRQNGPRIPLETTPGEKAGFGFAVFAVGIQEVIDHLLLLDVKFVTAGQQVGFTHPLRAILLYPRQTGFPPQDAFAPP